MMKATMLKDRKGASLVTAVMVITVVSVAGVMAAALFSSKTAGTAIRLSSVRAQFIAEGGLEWGIRQYKQIAPCAEVATTTHNLGGGQFKASVTSKDTTPTCAGVALESGQACVRSTGTYAGAVRVMEQIATCSAAPLAAVTIGAMQGGTIDCGPKPVCKHSWWPEGYTGNCDCMERNSARTFPPVALPQPAPPAPGGVCEFNKKKAAWDGGTYYCASLYLNAGSNITLNGPVTIYTSYFEMNGSDLNRKGLPANLLVMVTGGGSVKLNAGSSFEGFIYAPVQASSGVTMGVNGNSQVTGGIVAYDMLMDSTSGVTWDSTAGTSAPDYNSTGGGSGDASVSWREAPP